MQNPKLVNAVGGGSLPQELDLQRLHEAFDGEEVRYDPEYWPGLYLRFTASSPAIMIFRTGKYNIAGADSIQDLNEANEEFLSRIQELGIDVNNASFDIRNLVLLGKYDRDLNLDQVVIALGLENAEYEPEQFPGILYRATNTTGTFMIFRNGKVILTGGKTKDDAVESFSNLFYFLDGLFS